MANPKRKAVEDYVIKYMDKLDKSGINSAKYKKMFSEMSDADFDAWMKILRDKKDCLVLWTPAIKVKLKMKDLLSVAKELNVKIFHRLKLWDNATGQYYLTPKEYAVLTMPVRRLSQFVDHKLSVAEGDQKIDMLSGQVMKPDQAGSISQTEVQTLYARGLTNTIKEIVKYRGGDVTAFAEFKRELEEQGSTTIARDTGSVPRAAVVLDSLFEGIMIQSNAAGGAY